MNIDTEIRDNVAIMSIVGDLTNYSAPDFNKARTELLSAGQVNFILNMEQVGLLSSIGIRELITLMQAAEKVDGAVKLCHLPEQVEDILVTTGLMGVLDAVSTLDEALAAFQT